MNRYQSGIDQLRAANTVLYAEDKGFSSWDLLESIADTYGSFFKASL